MHKTAYHTPTNVAHIKHLHPFPAIWYFRL